MNRLFVANKPIGISSNHFLSRLKRKYGVKKAGFSGTLDPFATGVLIVAFGKLTKVFRFLNLSPKCYIATLWLGANSPSLDNENIDAVQTIPPFDHDQVATLIRNLEGEITYYPPKFCAKKINGERAYDLARQGKEVELKTITSTVYEAKLLHYTHPFVIFRISISEGGYIRSMGHMIANKLGVDGTLSYLARIREGKFYYEDEKSLNWVDYTTLRENLYTGDPENLEMGRKLDSRDFKVQEDGQFFVKYHTKLAIIDIKDDEVSYLINGFMSN
jgi:tRNA pseudouridine55 synthase